MLAIAVLGTLTSTAYLLLVFAAVLRFQRRKRKFENAAPYLPAVSVLKPLHGLEPNLEANLETFFQQDYPNFELLFCARRTTDPGLLVARKLAEKYPNVSARIFTCGEPPWTNAKLYSLERIWQEAANDLLVIGDSDVRVSPSYLREIVKPFADAKIGMSTCIYRGVPTKGFWTRLEALGFSVEMTSGVVVAEMLEGMKFALGPTMVVRRQCVESLGGFSFMADYHADDYFLGNAVAKSGMEVALSHHTIDHMVVHESFLSSIHHQVGWMRSTRFSRPKGHFGTILTFAMPYGILGLAAGLAGDHLGLGISLLAIAVGGRIAQSIVAGYIAVGDSAALTLSWLYPLRDLLGAFVWAGSYLSSTMMWRGELYLLNDGGRLTRIAEEDGVPIASALETQGGRQG